MAAQRGLDLASLQFGGGGAVSIQFSRPPVDPPALDYPALQASRAVEQVVGHISTPPAPVNHYLNPKLWTNGSPPSLTRKD
jgi:hypothetical protein